MESLKRQPMNGWETVSNSRYLAPHGAPLHWSQDETGELRAAVVAYLEAVGPVGTTIYLDPGAFEKVRAYAHYFLISPCWKVRANERALILHAISQSREPAQLARLLARTMDWGIDVL